MSGSGNNTRTKERDEETTGIATVVGAVAGIALAAWGIAKLFSGSESETETSTNRKTMKAPGMDGRIYRDEFVKDPAEYFRNLRNKK